MFQILENNEISGANQINLKFKSKNKNWQMKQNNFSLNFYLGKLAETCQIKI